MQGSSVPQHAPNTCKPGETRLMQLDRRSPMECGVCSDAKLVLAGLISEGWDSCTRKATVCCT